MENKNYKIGDRVWLWEHWSERPVSGVITNIYTIDSKLCTEIHLDEGGTIGGYFEDLFPTKKKLLAHKKEKDRQVISKYKEEINNIEDLIRFMYDETISTGACEYTDYCARTAAREKAKELLNIELE